MVRLGKWRVGEERWGPKKGKGRWGKRVEKGLFRKMGKANLRTQSRGEGPLKKIEKEVNGQAREVKKNSL